MSPGRYLLTGASGFVGRYVAEALLARGHRVTGLDLAPPASFPEGVEPFVADLRDPEALQDLPRSWDGVLHLAGATIPSAFSSWEPVLLNLRITLNLLDHLEDSRVLLVSSCHVYGGSDRPLGEDDPVRPQGRYGLSKHLVEQVAPRYQERLDLRVARPFNHLGPGLRPELMVPSLLRRLVEARDASLPVRMAGLNSVRDFIDVRDVARAYLAILDLEDAPNPTFNVCTGQGRSVASLAEAALGLLGERRQVLFAGRPNSSDDIPVLVGNPARLAGATGWHPEHTLNDSLEAMLQALPPGGHP